jgi:hypothetical protein
MFLDSLALALAHWHRNPGSEKERRDCKPWKGNPFANPSGYTFRNLNFKILSMGCRVQQVGLKDSRSQNFSYSYTFIFPIFKVKN